MSDLEVVDKIISYEQGELIYEQTIDFFQFLVDTGLIYDLQGHYQRNAKYLLQEGIIFLKTPEN